MQNMARFFPGFVDAYRTLRHLHAELLHSAEQSLLKGFRHLRGRRNRCARCKPMERASGRATFWRSDPFKTMFRQPTAFKQYLKEARTATADPAIQHASASVIRANEAKSKIIRLLLKSRSLLSLHIKAIYYTYVCRYIHIPDIYVYGSIQAK